MRRDLIFEAFNNQPVNRVPIGFWFHFLPDAETADWRESPRLLEKNLASHQAFIRAFRPDMVKIMSDGFFLYPSPGLYQPLDLAMITPLSPEHGWIQAQATLARRVKATQEEPAYFYNIFSPITSLRFKLGLERLKAFHAAQPEAFTRALERMTQGLISLAKEVMTEGGVDGIYLSVQNPDQSYFSRDFCRKVLAPGEKAILQAAADLGGRNILHVCGYAGVKNDLSLYVDYPAEAYNWAVSVERVSLAEGRALFKNKAVIGGFPNGQDSILVNKGKAEINAFTRSLIREAGPTGYIIGADCTIPMDIELTRLDWVREAGLEAIRLGLGRRIA
ncbi:MAG: uroporphyrinogen decarboxylase [Deltaproteobacteria bacterium]|jgi:uroporphyrinogen decarboxylase|nr:uroporphyrinogen decarboxylase [Deltaproteobacteria bacterium]